MKIRLNRAVLAAPLCLLAAIVGVLPYEGFGQWPFATPTTPEAQRSALSAVRAQVDWLQKATRSAPSYGSQGANNLWQQFQVVQETYAAFRATLNPQQFQRGANSIAEIDAGLDIIQEAFANYEDDLAKGRSPSAALRDLGQVLRDSSRVWLQELERTCARLRVG